MTRQYKEKAIWNVNTQYDMMDETEITVASVNKNECNDGTYIEEIGNVSKEEKSRNMDDLKVRRESNEESQYDILDETE